MNRSTKVYAERPGWRIEVWFLHEPQSAEEWRALRAPEQGRMFA